MVKDLKDTHKAMMTGIILGALTNLDFVAKMCETLSFDMEELLEKALLAKKGSSEEGERTISIVRKLRGLQ